MLLFWGKGKDSISLCNKRKKRDDELASIQRGKKSFPAFHSPVEKEEGRGKKCPNKPGRNKTEGEKER